MAYRGFTESDSEGRRIVAKVFTDPVVPATTSAAANAVGRTGTVYLDELGRQRRVELELGADYQAPLLIAGRRSYDGAHR